MHIVSVSISGFRGINTEIPVSAPLGIIAGANNAGKSSVIDAIRCVLQPFADQQGQRWVSASDFTRIIGTPDETPDETPEIVITVNFAGISKSDRGQMISILSPKRGAGTARLTLRASLGADGRTRTHYFGGDFDQNEVESIAREGIRFVYLHPLRDAAADLRPGQSNRLASLVSAYAPDKHSDRQQLVEIIKEANTKLRTVPSVVKSAEAIETRLAGITGDGPFSHRTELGFSEPRYEKIINGLQALMGSEDVSKLIDNGLGYNNLLYVSVLLASLETDKSVPLNVLLVEEPEAHLHPQLQALLMQYLQGLSADNTQVIATSHSPQFTSSAKIQRVTVLSKKSSSHSPTAHELSKASLSESEFAHLGRFLDVTKSMMLFSQGVILVEGIAEQLLMSEISNRIGISLSNNGISVVSVDGLAFRPFIGLFGPGGLPFKCAVITDGDPVISNADEEDSEEDTDISGTIEEDSDISETDEEEPQEDTDISATAKGLLKLATDQIGVHVATRTFEWDLAYANFNTKTILLKALKKTRPRLGPKIEKTAYASAIDFADAVLSAIKEVKGPFAQHLADALAANKTVEFNIPSYLSNAIKWVATND